MPHSSSIFFFSSTSSSTDILPSASKILSTVLLPFLTPPLRQRRTSSASCLFGVSSVAVSATASGSRRFLGGRLGLFGRGSAAASASAAGACGLGRPAPAPARGAVSPPARAARCGRRSGRCRFCSGAVTSPMSAVSGAMIAPSTCAAEHVDRRQLRELADLVARDRACPAGRRRGSSGSSSRGPRRASAFATATMSPSASRNAIARRAFEQREQRVVPAASAAIGA